jgi:hypothetical protein
LHTPGSTASRGGRATCFASCIRAHAGNGSSSGVSAAVPR